ncbi:phenazine biosynthesis protein [Nocardiopsis sp. EMB25]|uniref:phenazine biosynthesis protein n=1 Tax=Nocardiopsis sp. EMB25 TaxID=2835867 RepID=UPI0022853AF2|nr:phenazine biosynthesis protein [Nocardiopsis sp. EMB25]MCY9783678.1 phenazine biosynthesis protein [Nocardiopsis sp. EMB25]
MTEAPMHELLDGWTAPQAAADPDAYLRAILEWHFSPATGSPFWLERAPRLGFDPIADVKELGDLRRFPDLSDELRTVRAEDLVPTGAHGTPFEVFESGGTTGAPKRVVDGLSRGRNVDWVSRVLSEHGFPEEGNWLHVGPSGPHVVGRTIKHLAASRGGLCFTVDFDPRWVKKLLAQGRTELAAEYREYLLDQVELIVDSQDIRVLFITPPVLESLCSRASLYERVAQRLEGLMWAGTSVSPETLWQIENTFFPNASVAAIYGNTIMGIAPQRPRLDDDTQPCVFVPFFPQSVVEVIDAEGAPVAYGERGRVLMHLLARDMFLPNVLERDTAIRLAPAPGGTTDGLADIAPFQDGTGTKVIEGVY